MKAWGVASAVFVCAMVSVAGAQNVNINDVPNDLTVPDVTDEAPAAGRRSRCKHAEFAEWNLSHALYLPTDWKPGGKFPVIVEYPGNGDYRNSLGDVSRGRVEDCKLGYGISGGKQFIWVSLPIVDSKNRQHALTWWGDPDATAAYCRRTVAQVCADFGGDVDSLILAGFSRGALACGYIGLRDDETAKLWKAMIAHSHFDGVRRWNQPQDDRESAKLRLTRFRGRPIFASHETTTENSIDLLRDYLREADFKDATLMSLPFPNHTDQWVLKDLPERQALRAWLAGVLTMDPW